MPARLGRPRRRGRRGGQRARRARERGSGDYQPSAPGTGAPNGPCRVGCQLKPDLPPAATGTATATITYDRAHLLAARDRASSDVTETIRRSLPPRLNHLVRRAGGNIHARSLTPRLNAEPRPRQAVAETSHPARSTSALTHVIRPSPRCLAVPPRLTLQQTRRAVGSRAAAPQPTNVTITTASASITLELLNVQSLLPKLPDVRSELSQRNADILCFTETNLRTSTPNRFVDLPGYTIFRRDG